MDGHQLDRGHLNLNPSMGAREDYEAMATAAGFAVTGYEDVSRHIARTWPICAGRLLEALLVDRETRRTALGARDRCAVLSIRRTDRKHLLRALPQGRG